MKNLLRSIGLAAVVGGLVLGGQGRANAALIITGTPLTLTEGNSGSITYSVQNTGPNAVDFTTIGSAFGAHTGDSEGVSVPFIVNTFSVDAGATVLYPFTVNSGPADVGEPIDFSTDNLLLNITAKDRVTGAVVTGSGGALITINDAPLSTPEPSSLALACVGSVLGLGYAWRRGRKV